MLSRIFHRGPLASLQGATSSSSRLPGTGPTHGPPQPSVGGSRNPGVHPAHRITTAFTSPHATPPNLVRSIQSSRLWQRIVANGATRANDAKEFGTLIALSVAKTESTTPATLALLQHQFAMADRCLDGLEMSTGIRLGECRYHAKRRLLEHSIATPGTDLVKLVHGYHLASYFRGKTKILNEAVRRCMEADLDSEFGIRRAHEPRQVRRLSRNDLAACSQPAYVRHVCNLFNLEAPVSLDAWTRMFGRAGHAHRHAMTRLGLSGTPPDGMRFKDAVSFLAGALRSDTDCAADKRMRNQHPASVLLEASTGLVYHPHFENAALTDIQSGFAFLNIAETLRTKYLAAKQHGDLHRFFKSAFVRQDPCYEAVAENIMNYASVAVLFYPKPSWINGVSDEDNLSGLLAWVQRALVPQYASEAGIDLLNCDADALNRIESSRDFCHFLASQTDTMIATLIKESGPFAGTSLIRQIVEDDLALGMQLAAGPASNG